MSDDLPEDFQDVINGLRPDGRLRFKSGVYRRFEELDDARNALESLGVAFSDLRQAELGQDPPDCTCIVEGELWGVEVTEILHPAVMQERLKGNHGQHHEWTDEEIVAAMDERIAAKDAAKPKGGPFNQYLLVIRTEEMHMERVRMEATLRTYEAHCDLITRACIAYSYQPHPDQPELPDYPTLPIRITRRSVTPAP